MYSGELLSLVEAEERDECVCSITRQRDYTDRSISRAYRDAGLSYMFNVDFFHLPSQMQAPTSESESEGARGGRVKYVVDATYVCKRRLSQYIPLTSAANILVVLGT